MDGYQQPASIRLHYKIFCEFDIAFLFSVFVVWLFKSLLNKKKNLSTNFSMEKSEYHIAVKEMKAQKQKEELARRKNERLVSLKEV